MRFAAICKLLFLIVPLSFGAVTLAPGVSWGAVQAYLKISDCQPSGTSKVFTGQILLSGFSSRLKIPVIVSGGGGAGTGKAQLAPIELLKNLDSCSPRFFLDAVMGTAIQTAEITFYQTAANGTTQAFFKITLKDVVISGLETTSVAKTGQEDIQNIQDPASIELNSGGIAGVQEVLSLMFRQIELKDLKTNTTVTFDVAANGLQ